MAQGVSGPAELSAQDRSIITLIQASFPLVRRPFEVIAGGLGTSEEAVLGRLARLKEAGLVRKIGPVLEPARFGISSELIAVQVSPEELERVGEAVSLWRPVTHCYARSHPVNLWLAALSAEEQWFEEARERILARPGVLGVWRLPAVRRFKVAVRFDLTGQTGPDVESPAAAANEMDEASPAPPSSSAQEELDLHVLAALEADLPLHPEPFSALALTHGLDEAQIISTLQQWRANGRIRRYGALVSHLRLGFVANAMTVWQVSAERVEEVGTALASSSHVSHCYERPAFPEFPFNLYAMVHERSRERCTAVVEELSGRCRDSPRAVLFSTSEFKKSSPRYAELLAERVSPPEGASLRTGTSGTCAKQSTDGKR
jgi:DNA-binding Lrp family transcriptional regulator